VAEGYANAETANQRCDSPGYPEKQAILLAFRAPKCTLLLFY
jgi:hypothetical protein